MNIDNNEIVFLRDQADGLYYTKLQRKKEHESIINNQCHEVTDEESKGEWKLVPSADKKK